eukprot:CAMPEP_0183513184 /NCGR_PEP_ID=MMETSP0371-20130417/12040_1 /TAXON_ID=268820 /ORGANISM="Peridinium aciculiferum, Strain PAER-2" /LENGTH=204 /DNA_ID=CAMNT_0025710379 /DNA_START=18 /DNA_END=629 /DNA_ORIENTATION=-
MSSLPPLDDGELSGGCYSNGRWLQGGLAPWHPTDDSKVRESLAAAGLGPSDVLLELGCGDGKICRAAAEQMGCRSIGVEIDEVMVQMALDKRGDMPEHLRKLVEIRLGDLVTMELEVQPTCATMYLMPEHYGTLEPLLERLASQGVKLIVYQWELRGDRWKQRLVAQGKGWWLYRAAVEPREKAPEALALSARLLRRLISCQFW